MATQGDGLGEWGLTAAEWAGHPDCTPPPSMGDRGAQGPSSETCLYLPSSASPVIENGQLECPKGYKRLNLTHCQGKDDQGQGWAWGGEMTESWWCSDTLPPLPRQTEQL